MEKFIYGLGILSLALATPHPSWATSWGELRCFPQLTLTTGAIAGDVNLKLGTPLEPGSGVAPVLHGSDGFSIPLKSTSDNELPEIQSVSLSSNQIEGLVQFELELMLGETAAPEKSQLMGKITLTHKSVDSTSPSNSADSVDSRNSRNSKGMWGQATLVAPLVMGTRIMLDFSSKHGNLDHGVIVCRLFP